ncbi:MAG: Cna B-type domain-containing protein [Clostridia bacterium]|nr:Cna B-type domain-containing protein [Clostridia bacterium]
MKKIESFQAETFLKNRKRHEYLRRGVAFLSAFVMLFTMNTLKQNADTLERVPMCHLEEHAHTADCYDAEGALICGKEAHEHTDACYQERPVYDEEEIDLDELVEEVELDLADGALDTEALVEAEAEMDAAEWTYSLDASALLSDIVAALDMPVRLSDVKSVGPVENDEAHTGLLLVEAEEGDYRISALRAFAEAELAIVTSDDILVVKLTDGAPAADEETEPAEADAAADEESAEVEPEQAAVEAEPAETVVNETERAEAEYTERAVEAEAAETIEEETAAEEAEPTEEAVEPAVELAEAEAPAMTEEEAPIEEHVDGEDAKTPAEATTEAVTLSASVSVDLSSVDLMEAATIEGDTVSLSVAKLLSAEDDTVSVAGDLDVDHDAFASAATVTGGNVDVQDGVITLTADALESGSVSLELQTEETEGDVTTVTTQTVDIELTGYTGRTTEEIGGDPNVQVVPLEGNSLPADATASISEVAVPEGIVEETEEQVIEDAKAYDITITNDNGDEISETGAVAVTVTPEKLNVLADLPEGATAGDIRYTLYHVHDDGVCEPVEDVEFDVSEDGTVNSFSFITESFSTYIIKYTVDFEYTDAEGNVRFWQFRDAGSYRLSEVLAELGIEGTILKAELRLVELSGEETESGLYLTQDEDGEWWINSDAAFDDTYELTVVVDGYVYTITVTDAQPWTVNVNLFDYDGATPVGSDALSALSDKSYAIVAVLKDSAGNVVGYNKAAVDFKSGTNTAQCEIDLDNCRSLTRGDNYWTEGNDGSIAYNASSHTVEFRLYEGDFASDQWQHKGGYGSIIAYPDSVTGYEFLAKPNGNVVSVDSKTATLNLKRAYDKQYNVRLEIEPAGLTVTEADEYYLFITARHQTSSATYSYAKITVDPSQSVVDIPITDWYDTNGNKLQNEKFTGNEDITIEIYTTDKKSDGSKVSFDSLNSLKNTQTKVLVAEGSSLNKYNVYYGGAREESSDDANKRTNIYDVVRFTTPNGNITKGYIDSLLDDATDFGYYTLNYIGHSGDIEATIGADYMDTNFEADFGYSSANVNVNRLKVLKIYTDSEGNPVSKAVEVRLKQNGQVVATKTGTTDATTGQLELEFDGLNSGEYEIEEVIDGQVVSGAGSAQVGEQTIFYNFSIDKAHFANNKNVNYFGTIGENQDLDKLKTMLQKASRVDVVILTDTEADKARIQQAQEEQNLGKNIDVVINGTEGYKKYDIKSDMLRLKQLSDELAQAESSDTVRIININASQIPLDGLNFDDDGRYIVLNIEMDQDKFSPAIHLDGQLLESDYGQSGKANSSHVLYNLRKNGTYYTGEVNTSRAGAGIILAPAANAHILDGPFGGTIITDRVNRMGNELHSNNPNQIQTLNAVIQNVIGTPKVGSLELRKDYDDDTTKDKITYFTFEVQLSNADMSKVAGQSFPASGLRKGNTVTFDAEGKATVQVRAKNSVTIANLPEGTTYTVKELVTPETAHFTYVRAEGDTGEIEAGKTAKAVLYNTIRKTGLVLEKKVVGTDASDKSFNFTLYLWNERENNEGNRTEYSFTNLEDVSFIGDTELTFTPGTYDDHVAGVSNSFTLKNGEKLTVDGLAAEMHFALVETGTDSLPDGYSVTSLGATVDEEAHTVTVVGQLDENAAGRATIYNAYTASGELTLRAGKAANEALGDREFTFVLADASEIELNTVTAKQGETKEFSALSFVRNQLESDENEYDFTVASAPTNYTLKIFERIPDDAVATDDDTLTYATAVQNNAVDAHRWSKDGVIYDATVKSVTVTVRDNGNGTLDVSSDLEESTAIFTNTVDDTKTSVTVQKAWSDSNPDAKTAELYLLRYKKHQENQNQGGGTDQGDNNQGQGDNGQGQGGGITVTVKVVGAPDGKNWWIGLQKGSEGYDVYDSHWGVKYNNGGVWEWTFSTTAEADSYLIGYSLGELEGSYTVTADKQYNLQNGDVVTLTVTKTETNLGDDENNGGNTETQPTTGKIKINQQFSGAVNYSSSFSASFVVKQGDTEITSGVYTGNATQDIEVPAGSYTVVVTGSDTGYNVTTPVQTVYGVNVTAGQTTTANVTHELTAKQSSGGGSGTHTGGGNKDDNKEENEKTSDGPVKVTINWGHYDRNQVVEGFDEKEIDREDAITITVKTLGTPVVKYWPVGVDRHNWDENNTAAESVDGTTTEGEFTVYTYRISGFTSDTAIGVQCNDWQNSATVTAVVDGEDDTSTPTQQSFFNPFVAYADEADLTALPADIQTAAASVTGVPDDYELDSEWYRVIRLTPQALSQTVGGLQVKDGSDNDYYYAIVEKAIDGYTVSYEPGGTTPQAVSGSALRETATTLKATNTSDGPQTGSIKIIKTVNYNGEPDAEAKGKHFYIGVYSDEAGEHKVAEAHIITGYKNGDAVADNELDTPATGWTVIKDLPLGDYYVYEMDGSGAVKKNGSSATMQDGNVYTIASPTEPVTISATDIVEANVTNSRDESGSIEVEKIAKVTKEGEAPRNDTTDQDFYVGLFKVTTDDSTDPATETETYVASDTIKAGGKVTFGSLEIGSTYRVYELSAAVTEDDDAESIAAKKLASGDKLGEYTVTYQNETQTIGRGDGKDKTGIVVTNERNLTDYVVQKRWMDSNGKWKADYGAADTDVKTIYFKLYRTVGTEKIYFKDDGTPAETDAEKILSISYGTDSDKLAWRDETAEENESTGVKVVEGETTLHWVKEFTDLPGTRNEYTIVECDKNGNEYTKDRDYRLCPVLQGDVQALKNNLVEASNTKAWTIDGEDAGSAFDSYYIKLQLMRDGEPFLDPQIVGKADDNWSYHWYGLPEYNPETGAAFVYTVKEIGVYETKDAADASVNAAKADASDDDAEAEAQAEPADSNNRIGMFDVGETREDKSGALYPTTITNDLHSATIRIAKVAKGTETALSGAKFQLKRQLPGETAASVFVNAAFEQDAETKKRTGPVAVGADGLALSGLLPGTYTIEEVEAPAGYIIMLSSFSFTIDNKGVVSYESKDNDGNGLVTYAKATNETDATFTVENEAGVRLPSTGGMGTGLIYATGAGLLLLAVLGWVLSAKKRDYGA